MDTSSLPPQLSAEHTTVVTFRDASGTTYCALTPRDGEQPQCVISRRIGSNGPSLVQAMHYATHKFYSKCKPDSITCIDHRFEVTAAREILHNFEVARLSANGAITHESLDLKMHEAMMACVQTAVRLLLKIGA